MGKKPLTQPQPIRCLVMPNLPDSSSPSIRLTKVTQSHTATLAACLTHLAPLAAATSAAKLERGTIAEPDHDLDRPKRALAETFLEDAASSQRRSQHGSDQPGRLRAQTSGKTPFDAGPAVPQPLPRARGRAVQACALHAGVVPSTCSATEGSTVPEGYEGRRGSTLPNVQRLPPHTEPEASAPPDGRSRRPSTSERRASVRV